MKYSKDKTSCISFPLGGIGTGSIGIAGNGALVDWEIFNAPAKGSYNGLSHFAVRAEEDGKVVDFRVLNGDLAPHYMGEYTFERRHQGYGYGPAAATLCNLPHFRTHSFEGTYPVCRLDFGGEKFPARCSLTAWSVLIPGDSEPSSLPAAFFEAELENDTGRPVTYTVLGILTNPWSEKKVSAGNEFHDGALTCHDGCGTGDLTLAVDSPGSTVSHQTYFYRGGWRDALEIYYRDLLAGGDFKERLYPGEKSDPIMDSGLVSARFTLQPGEKKGFPVCAHLACPVPFHGRDPRPE